MAHPVNDVLKTTSPTWVPEAPNDLAFQIEPSSSTSLASEFFQGLSPFPIFQAKKQNHISSKQNQSQTGYKAFTPKWRQNQFQLGEKRASFKRKREDFQS